MTDKGVTVQQLVDLLNAATKTFATGDKEIYRRAKRKWDAELGLGTEPVYLVWSHEHGAWWRPNKWGYTDDVWAAGRYDEASAAEICRKAWRGGGAEPPEVMVLAPEHGRDALTVEEIREVPDLMRRRIDEATRAAIAERQATPR